MRGATPLGCFLLIAGARVGTRGDMRRALAVLGFVVVGGCTWVYDAQYEDRRGELEAFREDFLPATDRVQFFTSAEQRIFWVSIEKPLDEALLHSSNPDGSGRVDYELTRGIDNIAERFKLSDQLIVDCGFSDAKAFAASGPNTLLDMTDQASDECAVAGSDVYFRVGATITRWRPGQGAPVQVVDLAAQRVGTGDASFGALGNLIVYEEGGRLWKIDLPGGTATWLENADVTSGAVFFDERGVVYNTNQGVTYTQYSDHASSKLDDLVADGGYELGGDYKDAFRVPDGTDCVIHDQHIIYRGFRGIFAYGLETTKVVDLLLDDGQGFDATLSYRHPAVTTGGALFVQNDDGINSDDHPVYRLTLDGRLR